MTTRSRTFRHLVGGGWGPDFGPTVDVTPDESGKVIIPHLIDAENVLYKLNGGFQKIGGTTRVNATQISSATIITGLYDYWKQGTTGSPTRRRVLHTDTKVLSDTDDGAFTTEVFTGFESGKVPSYATFDDLLIISSDSNTDVPSSWDQTTAQNLAGSPPNFAFSASHRNRHWAAGVVANPSRLYYSANVDPEDWIGSGSGNIDIDPNDGDMITGIASHRNELWVFKGPYKGSIHRITGSAPTGDDGFARKTFIRGLGAAWHNSIVSFSNDLGFIAHDGTFRSLSATDAFGDFLEASLSRPIHTWLKDHLNYNRLKNIWAVDDPGNSRIFITLSIDSSSTNNVVLMMDYRFKPFRWALWSAIEAGSLAFFEDTSSFKRVLIGGNDGYVRRLDIVDRSIDTATAISAKVTTPYLNYGLPLIFKNIFQASIGISPKGNYNGTFGWTRDDNSQQTQDFAQDGGDVLAPATNNEFTLGTSTLSGSQFVDRHMELEEGGSFRSIQYQLTQTGLNEDLEVHAISATITSESVSTEN